MQWIQLLTQVFPCFPVRNIDGETTPHTQDTARTPVVCINYKALPTPPPPAPPALSSFGHMSPLDWCRGSVEETKIQLLRGLTLRCRKLLITINPEQRTWLPPMNLLCMRRRGPLNAKQREKKKERTREKERGVVA